MTRQGGGLRCHAFHQIAIADQAIGKVIDNLMSGPVITGGEKGFRHRHPHSIPKPLAERPGGHFDTGGEAAFRMSRGHAVPLAKLLDLVERKIITGEVQQTIQQHRTMPCR